jgi:hypothetical protein
MRYVHLSLISLAGNMVRRSIADIASWKYGMWIYRGHRQVYVCTCRYIADAHIVRWKYGTCMKMYRWHRQLEIRCESITVYADYRSIADIRYSTHDRDLSQTSPAGYTVQYTWQRSIADIASWIYGTVHMTEIYRRHRQLDIRYNTHGRDISQTYGTVHMTEIYRRHRQLDIRYSTHDRDLSQTSPAGYTVQYTW